MWIVIATAFTSTEIAHTLPSEISFLCGGDLLPPGRYRHRPAGRVIDNSIMHDFVFESCAWFFCDTSRDFPKWHSDDPSVTCGNCSLNCSPFHDKSLTSATLTTSFQVQRTLSFPELGRGPRLVQLAACLSTKHRRTGGVCSLIQE